MLKSLLYQYMHLKIVNDLGVVELWISIN